MQANELEAYLHEHIPISRAMGVRVLSTDPLIRLSAPLADNVNHRGTVFGGSLAAVTTLAAWSALRVKIGAGPRLVVAKESIEFLRPVPGDFEAVAELPTGEGWSAFLSVLERRGRARIDLEATISDGEAVAVRLSANFAALRDAP